MLKPQRLLARRPLDQLPKQRLRALKPRDRARIGPWRAGLLAAHRPPITIHASQRWFAHRAVSLPGAIEQVEQIWSHAITSVPRSERDITSRLSAPPPRTPSETPRSNPGKSTHPRTTRRRSGAIYPLQTTCTHSTPVGKSAITKLDSISRAHPVHRSRSVFARPAPTGTACLPTRPGM